MSTSDVEEGVIANRDTQSPEPTTPPPPESQKASTPPPPEPEPAVAEPGRDSPDQVPPSSGSPEPLLGNEEKAAAVLSIESDGEDNIVVSNPALEEEEQPAEEKEEVPVSKEEDLPAKEEPNGVPAAEVVVTPTKGKELELEEPVPEVKKSDETEVEVKKSKPKLSLVFKLFSYATAFDWFLMFLGTVTAICHGAALPAFTIVFGDFINVFINQAFTQTVGEFTLPFTNMTEVNVDCSDPMPFLTVPSETVFIPFNALGGDTVFCPHNFTEFSNYSSVVAGCGGQCLDNEGFIREANILVYIFIGIAVGIFILAYSEIYLFQTACERQVKKIRLAFYRAIMRQEVGWFDANPSGELASRISDDVDKIHDGIGDKVGLLIQWLATFVGGFVVAFIEDWRLTLLLLAFTPLLVIAGFFMAKLTSSYTSQEQKGYASAGAVAEEVLASIRTVVAFGGEKKECERYDDKLKEARKVGTKKGMTVGLNFGFVFFLFFALDGVAFWFGGYLIQEQIVEGGDVLTVFFAVLIGAFALGQAGPNLQVLLTAAGAADTIFETIERKPLIDPASEEGEKPESFDGTVEFRDVAFTYPTRPDVPVLDGFSLNVEVGKTFALVGPSGCGKSTVMQLLQRFYDPDGGEVLLGGKDVRTLNIKWLRQHIGVVSQEPVLFDTTIAQNIMYGKEDATEEQMIQAAKGANAHGFISELPDGYKTLVGEAGTQLSGGQKQRIAIARALIRDPKILLLDEATSALDTESESIVQQALDNARTGRTTIVIAHRLSTIQNADVIASVEDGRITEKGSHSELMDKGGLYYELVTAQSYGADEQFIQGVGSPQRLLSCRSSMRGSKRRRHTSGSESEAGIEKQTSIVQRQASVIKSQGSKQFSEGGRSEELKKKQEEWDKEIPEVPLWRVIAKNGPEWWIIILGLVGAVVNGVIFPSFALFFGQVLQVFTLPPNEVLSAIHLWAGLFIVLGTVSGVAIFFKTVCFTVSGENLTARLRSLAFKAMLRQEIAWFDQERNSSGALVTRLADDAAKVQGATGTRLGTLLETFVGMFMAIIVAFVYSWVLTLLILGVVPIVLFSSALEVKALSGHTVANKKALENAGKIAVDSISNIRTVASLSLEPSFYKEYSKNVKTPYKKALFNCVIYGVTYAISQGVIFLMYALVFRFGAFQILQPESNVAHATFDQIIVVFFALVFGAAGAGQAGAFAPNYSKARLSASRIFNLLDRMPEIDSYSEDGEKLEKVNGDVATHDLNFNYPSRPDVRVLKGLDITIKSGKTLALVGPSGCGKSTVVSLLERFYNPTSGSLTLDENNIVDLNVSWLRSQIGIVSQEPVLFDRSIADNIRYGANYREVSSEEVVEAAKAANIHRFVESLPQGYDTNVGMKGTQLSGGQKQRIAIARALVRNPKILLLDEATSALDTESEKIVQEALDKAREGRTSIVIAHRLSTIYNSDCIVVISGGQAVEKGTHSELMAEKGIYYKLNRFQVVETSASEPSLEG